MKKTAVLILYLLCGTFIFAACQKQERSVETTIEKQSSTINNIYITDDGIFLNTDNSTQEAFVQNEVAQSDSFVQTSSMQESTTEPIWDFTQYTADMVIAAITDAVNFAKSQTDFSAHQLQQVTINLTDCTFSWAVPIINGAISIFNGPHNFDYKFTNGTCPDPKEDFETIATPMSAIPPSDKLFALEADGIVSYAAYEENGEYVYTVTLVSEYTNSNIAIPYYHAQAMDYLDLGDFDFGIGEITDANCNYPGAVVTVRTKPDGTLLKYEETIPMNGSGTGKLGISLSASFEGSMYECWTFEW